MKREIEPSRLSHELRTETSLQLKRRRQMIGLSLVASGAMGVIALYQTGLIRHLPEPPLPIFDADRIDASDEAYSRFATPDAILGIGSYAATMGLAAMGGKDRARDMPLVPLALAAKIVFDVGNAVRLTVDQWTKFRAFCFWCLLAAGSTFAMAPLVIGEAKEAARTIARGRRDEQPCAG